MPAHTETTLHRRTPLIPSDTLSRRIGGQVWLKLEALQPGGSFKIRGIGRLCARLVRDGVTRLISSSGGNAGLAVAHAGRALKTPVTVVLPATTPEETRQRIANSGAEVQVHGDVWDVADALARELAGRPGHGYVSPFDHPEIWAGHATLVHELARQLAAPDLIVLSVGGGGLLCGVIQGLDEVGWGEVPVLAVETAGADSLARSHAAGRLVTLDTITSLATSLGARQVASQALRCCQTHAVSTLTVSDQAAVAACLRLLDEHRLLVEPACGATLAALEPDLLPVSEGRTVVAIVCGGAVVSLKRMLSWARMVDHTDAHQP